MASFVLASDRELRTVFGKGGDSGDSSSSSSDSGNSGDIFSQIGNWWDSILTPAPPAPPAEPTPWWQVGAPTTGPYQNFMTSPAITPADYGQTYWEAMSAYVGEPYVWGGNDVAKDGGLDCSGSVLAGLRDIGYSQLPDLTADEFARKFTYTTTEDPRVGDTRVLTDSNGKIVHIQVLGENERINATGDSSNTRNSPGVIELLSGEIPNSGEIRRINWEALEAYRRNS